MQYFARQIHVPA
jgi:hypothetical protein